jgi:transcriptional regulator with XRE-family HTH domain
MFNAETVGRKISILRKKRGITQMELANRLGISFQAVSNWERGVAMPDIGNLKLLAQVLETTTDCILGDERTAQIISAAEEGKTPSEPIKPEEFVAVAPLLEPEQNDALLGAVSDPLSEEEASEVKPNLAFGGEYDKSDAELAEMFFERGNVAMFSVVRSSLPAERRRELLQRAISDGNMPFIAMLTDEMSDDDGAKIAEQAFESGNIALFAMFEYKLTDERKGELAMKAFEDGNIAFFSMLSYCLSPEQRRICRNRAAADNNVAMFAVLSGGNSDGKEHFVGNEQTKEHPRAEQLNEKKRQLQEKFAQLSGEYARLEDEYNRMQSEGAREDDLDVLEDRMDDLEDELDDIEDEIEDLEDELEELADPESISQLGDKLSGLKDLLGRIGSMFK